MASQEKFWLPPGARAWTVPWTPGFPDGVRSPTDFLPNDPRWRQSGAYASWKLLDSAYFKDGGKSLKYCHDNIWKRIDESYIYKQHEIPFYCLTHATHQAQAAEILQLGTVRALFQGSVFSNEGYRDRDGQPISCGEGLESLGRLVWFGVCPGYPGERVECAKKVAENVVRYHTDQDIGNRKHYYATSPLFNGRSYYGNFAFNTNLFALLNAVVHQESVSANTKSASQLERNSVCFHSGGTLAYQAEVAYVVVVAPFASCAKMCEQGFPCLKTFWYSERGYFEDDFPYKPCPFNCCCFSIDQSMTPNVVTTNPSVPVKFGSIICPGRTCASARMYIKSTTTNVQIHQDCDPFKNFLRSRWEHVIFAVREDKLSFTDDQIQAKLVDHEVGVCRFGRESEEECTRAGLKSKEDLRRKLAEELSDGDVLLHFI